MSQTTAGRASGQPPEQGAESPRGVFGRLFLFLRQVVGELRKVVTPTRKELLTFTGVVLAFVIVMMVIVSLLDQLFGYLAIVVFGNGA